MKQIREKNTLYVIDKTAYLIIEDTDAAIINVPEDSYSEYVALNPSLTLTKYNYNTIRCTYDSEYFKPILNSITIKATDISALDCLKEWVKNVSATGTITKKAGVTYPTGVNGIPSGWTINKI